MERVRGANGQFVEVGSAAGSEAGSEELKAVKDEAGRARAARRVRTPALRNGARRAFARALPLIIETLIEEAKAGSVAHVKLLIQMEKDLLAAPVGERKGKSLEAILQAQWKKDAELYGSRRGEVR